MEGFWCGFKTFMKNESSKRAFRFKELSPNEIDIETQNDHRLHVRFDPEDHLHPLFYELENGTLKNLQFVRAGKPYFRYEGVNYNPEALGKKMFRELLAAR